MIALNPKAPMETYTPALASRFAELLQQREADLHALLRSTGDTAEQAPEQTHEVTDFKELASEETQAAIDDAQAAHAAHELALVLAARRRLHDGGFGECTDCGEPVDLRRLLAMPATPFCTACQAIHEHERPPARR